MLKCAQLFRSEILALIMASLRPQLYSILTLKQPADRSLYNATKYFLFSSIEGDDCADA